MSHSLKIPKCAQPRFSADSLLTRPKFPSPLSCYARYSPATKPLLIVIEINFSISSPTNSQLPPNSSQNTYRTTSQQNDKQNATHSPLPHLRRSSSKRLPKDSLLRLLQNHHAHFRQREIHSSSYLFHAYQRHRCRSHILRNCGRRTSQGRS